MHAWIANPQWRGKRTRHSRRMRNQQFYVSDKRPIRSQIVALAHPCSDWVVLFPNSIFKNLDYEVINSSWDAFMVSAGDRLPLYIMASSNENIFRVTSHLCRKFTGHRWIPLKKPVTLSFDVSFDLRPNKRLSKQWRRRSFETPSRSVWRHCNGFVSVILQTLPIVASLLPSFHIVHYSFVTWAWWCLKSLAIRLFVQNFV